MATPDSIGTAECANCAREVFVRQNAGGFAYYRCEACGVEVRHHIARQSAAFVAYRVQKHQAPADEKPVKAAAPAAQAADEKPLKAAPVAPVKVKAPALSLAGMLGGGA